MTDTYQCKKCRDALKRILDVVHGLNNKLTVINGVAEYVSHDPSLADDSKRMLVISQQACTEYSAIVQDACSTVYKCLKEIELCLKQMENE